MIIEKYNLELSEDIFHKDICRLTNQLWKLIPMRENDENWQKQLDTVNIELVGLAELVKDKFDFLPLLSKLEGLKNLVELDFETYRKTVFECISLLQRLAK